LEIDFFLSTKEESMYSWATSGSGSGLDLDWIWFGFVALSELDNLDSEGQKALIRFDDQRLLRCFMHFLKFKMLFGEYVWIYACVGD
jgi:hypothetical protein